MSFYAAGSLENWKPHQESCQLVTKTSAEHRFSLPFLSIRLFPFLSFWLLSFFPFFQLSGQSFKRSRTETPQHELEKVVTSQSSEIQSLKADKQKVETSFNNLRSEHDKALNENKILKRAVTIQQERQNQASSEIEAAHKYKFDAEERIKKLEQIILSLRYHLQAQQSNTLNDDFMGFRPPDVY